MKNNKAYLLSILLGSAIISISVKGQTSFTYEKGKMFNDITAVQMDKAVSIEELQSPVFYEKNIPEKQQTIAYRIIVPTYKQGIFFSRDSRPGDYQWPNNTNRLLPWVFNKLEELTKEDYPGIPSNGAPSVLGDALLLELADGQFLYTKAVSGDNSISWFQVNKDGSLTFYFGNRLSDIGSSGSTSRKSTDSL